MSPTRLSIFFGRLAKDLPHGPAGDSDLSEHLSRAVLRSGSRKLRKLFRDQSTGDDQMDGPGFAAKVRGSARVFGKLESEVIAEAVEARGTREAASRAAEHYGRVARTDGLAVQAAMVALLSLAAVLAIAALLSVLVLPRFAQALRELGIPMPLVTRGVVYGAVLSTGGPRKAGPGWNASCCACLGRASCMLCGLGCGSRQVRCSATNWGGTRAAR